jgi:hypothetical protein
VHIAEMQSKTSDFWLITDVKVLVWSREKSDIKANIAYAFTDQGVRDNLVNEMSGFDKQSGALQFEIKIRTGLIRRLLSLQPNRGDGSSQFSLESIAKEIFPNEDVDRVTRCLKDPNEFFWQEVRKKEGAESSSGRQLLPTPELQALAEEKRSKLKAERDKVEVLRHLLDTAEAWTDMTQERRQYLPQYSAEDWLAEVALTRAGRGAGVEAKVRAILRGLGLPESKIVYSQASRGYRLPRSMEEAELVTSTNARAEAERRITDELGPLVRKLNKKLKIHAYLSNNLKVTSIHISYVLKRSEKGAQWPEQRQWLSQRGFILEEDPWRTTAVLSLDVTNCKDLSAISSLVVEKLATRSP